MALVKVDALILRNLRMGETSRIVTFLSRELGKSSAVAKGVRAPKSRFGASLELLNISNLVLYFRPGRDLQLVSEGTLDKEFRGLFRKSERYHYACAVAEFLDRELFAACHRTECLKQYLSPGRTDPFNIVQG